MVIFNIVNIQFSLFENILIDRQFSENTSITRKYVMHTRRDVEKKLGQGKLSAARKVRKQTFHSRAASAKKYV